MKTGTPTTNTAVQPAAFTDRQWQLLTEIFGSEIERLSAQIEEQDERIAALTAKAGRVG